MEAIEARPLVVDLDEITRAGAFVTLDHSGQLSVYRGDVRPEDEPRVEIAAEQDGDHTPAGQGSDAELSASGHHASASVGTIITSGGQPRGAGLPEDEDDGAYPMIAATALRHAGNRCDGQCQ